MKGYEILNKKIGLTLQAGIFQSFFLDGEPVDRFNALFLCFDNWLRITSSEDLTSITEIEAPGQMESFAIDDSRFDYPLAKIEKELPLFTKYIGQTFISFNELVLNNDEAISCGLKFYFDKGLSLSLYNEWINGTDHTNFSIGGMIPDNVKEKIIT